MQRTALTILTIGHSTHAIDEFITLLRDHAVRLVADVRTIPKSRHNPQFNTEELTASLRAAGISYLHLKELGGLRRPKKDSPNAGWRNASFRGFADYMQTEEFETAVQKLVELAEKQRTVIMCAEAVPWRCHRSLIADALTVRGVKVVHIMCKTSLKEHAMTPWAKAEGTTITYPGPKGPGNASEPQPNRRKASPL
jgi:uncharacterized protein (DUF488 family)